MSIDKQDAQNWVICLLVITEEIERASTEKKSKIVWTENKDGRFYRVKVNLLGPTNQPKRRTRIETKVSNENVKNKNDNNNNVLK